ncbi:MAG: hypothetical protein Q7J31_19470 [Syntrophales bacterium]|nr:hypothetical protein [Syntrophales bacterium]
MTFRTKRLFTSLILIVLIFMQSCAGSAPVIPVKTYREPAKEVEAAARQQREMTETIEQLSLITENTVFTEKKVFPSILSVRETPFPSVTGHPPVTRHSSKLFTRPRSGRME